MLHSVDTKLSKVLLGVVADKHAAKRLRDEDDLYIDLGLDSLGVVDLAMALETAYNIEVDDDQIESLHTFGDVRRLVASAKQVEPCTG